MVATRRNRVAFALGQTSLQGKRLNSGELVEVARAIIEELAPQYARGFTSLHNILLEKTNSFDKRKLEQAESEIVKTALGEHNFPPSAMFIDLGSVVSFPSEPPVRQILKNGEPWTKVRLSVRTARLLLSRKGEVWLLRATQKPVFVREHDRGPDDYKYVVSRAELTKLDDAGLAKVFARYSKQHGSMVLGEYFILRLYRAQHETSDVLKGESRYAQRRTRKIARIVERLGIGIVRGEDE